MITPSRRSGRGNKSSAIDGVREGKKSPDKSSKLTTDTLQPLQSRMASTNISGAEALLRHLAEAGFFLCFANPGTTEAHIMGAFDKVPEIRPIPCLHETVTTGAADGFVRMVSKPALTLLHLGPGLANGLANLHNARRAGSAILNLVGDMASWHSKHDPLLSSNICQLATAVGAGFYSIKSRASVVVDTQAAMHQLVSSCHDSRTCQPVVLTLPHDYGWEQASASSANPAVEVMTSTLIRCEFPFDFQ